MSDRSLENAHCGEAAGLSQTLAGLIRPLEFAAADEFAHVGRMDNLGSAVQRDCQILCGFSIPSDLRCFFNELELYFSKEKEADEGRRRIREALSRLAPLRRVDWAEHMLARPLTALPGVGPKRAEALARGGLCSVADLLMLLPRGYDDRRELLRVGELEVGRRATFLAQLRRVGHAASGGARRGRGGRALILTVADESGGIELKWFRGGEALARDLAVGDWLLVSGEVGRYRFAKQLIHPEVERVEGPELLEDAQALRRVVARYAALEGVGPRTLQKLVGRALDEYADLFVGYLPASLVREWALPPAPDALRALHRPGVDADVEAYARGESKAHQRLVLEELYLLELGLALHRETRARLPAPALDVACARTRRAPSRLPFRLTRAQERVWQEICSDLARPHPMNRLLQGDVGCGKTAVALLAAVAAAASGAQTALMAPTELLAEQHARSLGELLVGAGDENALRIGLLTASLPAAEAAAVRARLAAGEIDLVVGTHALIQGGVEFEELALVVIDEQHRFGVRQRAALASKRRDGLHPHTLVMTATPIPRTLAMTLYGELDISVIDELPAGRKPVQTSLLREGEGRRVVQAVREAIGRDEQVYVVYPLIAKSEQLDLRAAIESARRIAKAFPECRVDLLHGRLSAEQRTLVMRRFCAGEIQILVCTTVIEVGVDVPRACLMVVEHAERFGLAQLHQLRGRVGRGEHEGSCVLVARGGGERAEARLRALLETSDGFAIADADLALRGPGELLGTRQSGALPDLRVADLVRDVRLLSAARQAALETLRRDPGLLGQPALRSAVEGRWGDRLDLARIG